MPTKDGWLRKTEMQDVIVRMVAELGSQQAFAKKYGYSHNFVSQMVNGVCGVSGDVAKRIGYQSKIIRMVKRLNSDEQWKPHTFLRDELIRLRVENGGGVRGEEAVAKMFNVNPKYVRQMCSGVKKPPGSTLAGRMGYKMVRIQVFKKTDDMWKEAA